MMWKDPIVEEVRQIRREIEAECGDDFEKIYEMAQERQRRYGSRLVPAPVIVPPKEDQSPHVERA